MNISILQYVVLILASVAIVIQCLALRKNKPREFTLVLFVRGAIVTTMLAISAAVTLAGWLIVSSAWLQILGFSAVIIALLLRIWAQLTLGRSWSVGVYVGEDHQLATGGPYEFLRHPMYAGYVLIAFGTVFLTLNALILACWFFALILVFFRAFEESRANDQQHSAKFRQWTTSRRMLFPPVYLILTGQR